MTVNSISGIHRVRGLYWHCEIAAMVLSQFPVNAYTKQHVRDAIRHATTSISSSPSYASKSAIQLLPAASAAAGLVKEHTVPVGVIVEKVMANVSPFLVVRDGTHRFATDQDPSVRRFRDSERNPEKVHPMGSIRAWEIAEIIKRWTVLSWVTKDEDLKLRKAGLHDRMPQNWDGTNRFARYEHELCLIECTKIKDPDE